MPNKKFILIILGFVILIGTIAGIAYWYNNPNRIVTQIRGQKIINSQLTDLAAKEKKFQDHNKQSKQSDSQALDGLIMEIGLNDDARKFNVKVTQQEIDAEYKKIVNEYPSEEAYIRQIKAAYDWTPALTKRSLRIRLLQEKLAPHLLSKRIAWGPFVRWDWYDDGVHQGLDKEKTITFSRQAIEKLLPIMQKGATKEEITAILAGMRKSEPTWGVAPAGMVNPLIGVLEHNDLLNTDPKIDFSDQDEFKTLMTLKNAGDNTDIIMNKAGYFVIYRLEKIKESGYKNWDEYLEGLKKEKTTKIQSLQPLIRSVAKINNAFKNNIKEFLIALHYKVIGKAMADPLGCSSTHYGHYRGFIKDANSSGLLRNSVEATLTATVTAGYTLPNCSTNPDPGTSATTTTRASDGKFDPLGNDGSATPRTINCYVHWDVVISAPGYRNRTLVNNNAPTNSSYLDLGTVYLTPIWTVNLVKSVTNSGKASIVSSPAGLSCGNSCNNESGSWLHDTAVTVTATLADQTRRISWSGYGGCSSSAGYVLNCSFTAIRDGTITAYIEGYINKVNVNSTGISGVTMTSSQCPGNTNYTCAIEAAKVNTTITAPGTDPSGYIWSNWTGCGNAAGVTCSVSGKTVTITVQDGATANITANYTTVPQYSLAIINNGTGTGRVTSTDGVIDCGVKCNGTYNSGALVTLNATETPPSTFAGWSGACSGTGACNVTMDAAKSVTATFNYTPPPPTPTTPPTTYSISGDVFVDTNGNKIKDAGESNDSSDVSFSYSGPVNGSYVGTAGKYSILDIPQGTYTLNYNSLPTGYTMVHPLTGPPPQFSATVGSGCTSSPTPGGICSSGNITDLNFAINNTVSWMQGYNLDMRFDSGFTDRIPSAPTYPSYALAVNNLIGSTPGIIYTGNTNADFGTNGGQASIRNWVVGGSVYPELFKFPSSNRLSTSYGYLLDNANRAQATIIDMNSISVCGAGGIANCTLSPTLEKGIYRANGKTTLNTYTFPTNKNYIFLINNDLVINGDITILTTSNSTALFSASGNIAINSGVGVDVASITGSTPPSGQIQGFFVAGQNFIIDSTSNCATEKMLNIDGAIVTNANGAGGFIENNRNLCSANAQYPTYTVSPRLDFILNAPSFILRENIISSETIP